VRPRVLAAGAVLVAAGLSACVTQHTMYDWGSYTPSLYHYYKDPTRNVELMASLEAIIKEAGPQKGAVPPGVYAEYGYLQLQQGRTTEAVGSFQQEMQRWPESKVFMQRMIAVASSGQKPGVDKEPH